MHRDMYYQCLSLIINVFRGIIVQAFDEPVFYIKSLLHPSPLQMKGGRGAILESPVKKQTLSRVNL